ncbi:MAG TPA: right-handed parallel beta-helix repeat-containing protein [Polyangiaceae bacterium]|jgi:MYXO-CTERM domain-containing protein|nr:right-handed parallel beta-helix repeat-containing protein [Polyangiaceae bacterium]
MGSFARSAAFGSALALATVTRPARAANTYYVAPTGSDSAAGSDAAPWASMAHAQSVAAPGDTVLFHGGTYAFTAGTSTCSSDTATINAITLTKSGTAGNRIMYFAVPGETPVFDFSGIKDSCRITGMRVTASYVYLKGLEIKGVPQNNTANHESWGIWNSGSNNVYELLNLHDNMGPGLFISDGGNNLVLNCDSHDNFDPNSSTGPGTNADGFGCHIGASGTGNVFRGCRAWFNADDGYDLIQAKAPVVIENSWAWNNGYRSGTTTASGGDGNGFKGGGYGKPPTNVPASPPKHVIQNCVAIRNRSSGFYANHHPVPNAWYNDTAFDNKSANFNMLGLDGDTDINVGVLRNNLAFTGTALANGTGGMVDSANNSWDTALGVSVSAADFVSTDATGWDAARQADGSLPVLTSLHLAAGSDLIDKGTDVGLPFNDAKPDLGAFETGAPLGTGGAAGMNGAGGGAMGGRGNSAGAANGGRNGGDNGGTSTASGGTSTASGGGDDGGASGTSARGGNAPLGGGSGVGSGGRATGGTSATAGGASGTAASGASGGTSNAGRGATGTGGAGTGLPDGVNGAAPIDNAEGCGCRTSGRESPRGAAFAIALLATTWIRRRRAALDQRSA